MANITATKHQHGWLVSTVYDEQAVELTNTF